MGDSEDFKDPKYKVGDVVTIKRLTLEDDKAGMYRFGVNSDMIAASGKSFKIRDIQTTSSRPGILLDDGYRYKLEGDFGGWSWASSMFEDPHGSTSSSNTDSISAFIRKRKCPELDFSL